MTEEHTTVHERADGGIERTTVITDHDGGGGSKGWVWIVIVLIIVAAGIYFATQMSGSETAKDAAITDAANEVGSAARNVGDAAQDAADSLQKE